MRNGLPSAVSLGARAGAAALVVILLASGAFSLQRPGRRAQAGGGMGQREPGRFGRPERMLKRAERQERQARKASGEGIAKPRGGRGRGMFLAKALAGANLRPEQRKQIAAVRAKYDAPMRALGRRIVEGRRTLEDLMYGSTPNPERAKTVARDLSVAAGEREKARTVVELEVLRALTPEQRAGLRALRATMVGEAMTKGETPGVDSGAMARPNRRDGRPVQDLGLSNDQWKQLRSLRQRIMPELRDLNRRRRQTQRSIDDAMLADAIDSATAERLASELGAIETERATRRFEIESALRSVLTADQAARLREIRHRRVRDTGADDGPALDSSRAPVL